MGEAISWDPDFIRRSPMFAPVSPAAERLRDHGDWPSRGGLQRILDTHDVRTAGGKPLRIVPADGNAEPYELRIRAKAEMPVRERNWHDLFNVLAWATYPRTKAALNDAHVLALASTEDEPAGGRCRSRRGPRRDALTLFDESGAIVLSSDPSLLDDVRGFRWKRLFLERRERVQSSMRFCVLGHALLEKALRPYVGLTAHAVLLEVCGRHVGQDGTAALSRIDALAAGAVAALRAPRDLAPLPVLGVPGWWPQNEQPAFYDNAEYFRPARRRS